MKRYCRLLSVAGLLAIWSGVVVAEGPDAQDFERLRFRNPGLTVDLKVGIWGSPCVLDFDGDGRDDLIMMSRNFCVFRNEGEKDGKTTFARQGWTVGEYKLSGHSPCPTVCDFDGDGNIDVLTGAEDGYFYFYENPISKKLPNAQVLLMGVFPRGRGKVSIYRTQPKAVNDILRKKYENDDKTTYVDAWDALLDKDGTLTKEVSHDSVHLTSEGFRRWRAVLNPYLKKYL